MTDQTRKISSINKIPQSVINQLGALAEEAMDKIQSNIMTKDVSFDHMIDYYLVVLSMMQALFFAKTIPMLDMTEAQALDKLKRKLDIDFDIAFNTIMPQVQKIYAKYREDLANID